MKAVFTHKIVSIYDDLPEERYHFPKTYVRVAEAAVDDYIIYYEPGRTGIGNQQRTGRKSYVATAMVTGVVTDPKSSEHYYATIDPLSYVAFERSVSFRKGEHFYEAGLRRDDGETSKGAFGRAVRSLPDHEFEAIVAAGFVALLGTAARESAPSGPRDERFPRESTELDHPARAPAIPARLMEAAAVFERPMIERLSSRPLRDAAFARAIQTAYGKTCAMTGLCITNGGGRAEVEAAHIKPVAERGPDSVRNGLALSRTVHWLFDRGFVSVRPPPRYEVLFSTKAPIPDHYRRLFRDEGSLLLPKDPLLRPAATYLEYHRDVKFKG